MKWADALKSSSIGRATREPVGGDEPNVILLDPKFPKSPKLFRADERYGWRRVQLREAEKFDNWQPTEVA